MPAEKEVDPYMLTWDNYQNPEHWEKLIEEQSE